MDQSPPQHSTPLTAANRLHLNGGNVHSSVENAKIYWKATTFEMQIKGGPLSRHWHFSVQEGFNPVDLIIPWQLHTSCYASPVSN